MSWGGCSPPPPPPWNFQNSHIRAKKLGNIRAKPLDFRASNGENIRAIDLSPPKRNWSHTPMLTLSGKCRFTHCFHLFHSKVTFGDIAVHLALCFSLFLQFSNTLKSATLFVSKLTKHVNGVALNTVL